MTRGTAVIAGNAGECYGKRRPGAVLGFGRLSRSNLALEWYTTACLSVNVRAAGGVCSAIVDCRRHTSAPICGYKEPSECFPRSAFCFAALADPVPSLLVDHRRSLLLTHLIELLPLDPDHHRAWFSVSFQTARLREGMYRSRPKPKKPLCTLR